MVAHDELVLPPLVPRPRHLWASLVSSLYSLATMMRRKKVCVTVAVVVAVVVVEGMVVVVGWCGLLVT